MLEVWRAAPAVIGVEVHACRARLASLGGDDNHAVGTCRTIDGGGRSILQHVYALYVVGVDLVVAAWKAVDDKQWRVVAVDRAVAA